MAEVATSTNTVEEVETWEVPIVLMQEIPKIKYHASPLQFMSEPGITQAQYEHMLLSGRMALWGQEAWPFENKIDYLDTGMVGWNLDCDRCFPPIEPLKNPSLDETITIKCPNSPDGTGLIFEVKKSTLIRSPAFAQFCETEHYLAGCHMQLTFIEDPAVCFQIVVHYLERGHDQFGRARLSEFVRTHLKLHDRFVLLLRLYRLASRLKLPVLVNISFDVMMEFDQEMSAGYCITVASLIFARNAEFDKRTKEWCLAHIRNYSYHFSQMREWTHLVPDLSLELQYHWTNFIEENKHAIATIHEEMLGTKRDEVDELLSTISESERRPSAIQDMNVEEVIQQVLDEEGSDCEEEWQELESLLQEPDRFHKGRVGKARASVDSAYSDKASAVLGLTPSRRTIDSVLARRKHLMDMEEQKKAGTQNLEAVGPVSSPEVAKARVVMGMNMLNRKHTGKTRRRLSKKVTKVVHS